MTLFALRSIRVTGAEGWGNLPPAWRNTSGSRRVRGLLREAAGRSGEAS